MAPLHLDCIPFGGYLYDSDFINIECISTYWVRLKEKIRELPPGLYTVLEYKDTWTPLAYFVEVPIDGEVSVYIPFTRCSDCGRIMSYEEDEGDEITCNFCDGITCGECEEDYDKDGYCHCNRCEDCGVLKEDCECEPCSDCGEKPWNCECY